MRSAYRDHWRTDNPTRVVAVTPVSYTLGKVLMVACENNKAVHIVYKDGRKITPKGSRLYIQNLTVLKLSDQWKVSAVESREVNSFDDQTECVK